MICVACQAPNDEAARSCIACGQALVADETSPRPGVLFAGRYQILEPLGRGGMGMVYKAHDRSLDETVALKVIRPDLARESHLSERFRSEIKLARRIRHKNVCSIYGDGEEQGVLWICMELVDGVELRRLLRERGGLKAAEAFDAAIQIGEGLQAIHEVGIIHRDLKTANVMRDSRGVVRLMDFGLAKQWRSQDSIGLTGTGHVVGTPDYMSPEQARGEKLTYASDIYALGVITFELFTGELPFRGETPLSTLLKHLHEPPPFEGPAGRRLPEALVPALRKALAKQPHERFESAAEMAQALRAAREAAANADGATPAFVPRLAGSVSATPPSVSPGTTQPAPTEAMPVTVPDSGPRGWRWLARAAVAAILAVLVYRSQRPPQDPVVSPLAPPAIAPAATRAASVASVPPAPLRRGGPSTVPVDEKGELIRHEPIGCLIANQFPLVPASVSDPRSVASARVYFKSGLGSAYYYVEMAQVAGRFAGKLPKPKVAASPINYYVEVTRTDRSSVRTPERAAVVARLSAECPAGSRVAEVGPPGAVTVFGAQLAMVSLRDALGLEALVSQMKDPDAGVREAAAEALQAVIPSVKAVVEKALQDLHDRDPYVREDAADNLESVSEMVVKEAMIPLVAALKDKDPTVQIKAAESLGEIGPLVASAAKALRAALRDPEPKVRKCAIDALASIGSVVGVTLTALEGEGLPGQDGNPLLNKAISAAHQRIEQAGR